MYMGAAGGVPRVPVCRRLCSSCACVPQVVFLVYLCAAGCVPHVPVCRRWCSSCTCVPQVVFLMYLWSIDMEAVLVAMSCFALLCEEADIRSDQLTTKQNQLTLHFFKDTLRFAINLDVSALIL